MRGSRTQSSHSTLCSSWTCPQHFRSNYVLAPKPHVSIQGLIFYALDAGSKHTIQSAQGTHMAPSERSARDRTRSESRHLDHTPSTTFSIYDFTNSVPDFVFDKDVSLLCTAIGEECGVSPAMATHVLLAFASAMIGAGGSCAASEDPGERRESPLIYAGGVVAPVGSGAIYIGSGCTCVAPAMLTTQNQQHIHLCASQENLRCSPGFRGSPYS